MPDHKPEGYTTVSPYLIVDAASKAIDFLCDVFDAERVREFPDDSGRLVHAEVRIGDSILMIADSATSWPAQAAFVHVYVPDVDATYARALKHGAMSVQAPEKKGDEDKRGGVKCAAGITWWIATQVG